MEKKHSAVRRGADFLFGGVKMSWPLVLILAVGTAGVTAVFMILPIFDNTSFREMGTTVEAWILFAIFIMVNCKTPLESALKTFVFFLVSQPLIYLIQVPFAEMGWQLFGYYRYWFIITLLTFPMAFVGWYLRRRDWLSFLILSPMIVILAGYGTQYLLTTIRHFPHHIVAAVFCFLQILLYLYVLFGDKWKRLAVLGVAAVTVIVMLIITPGVDTSFSTNLPDVTALSDQATVELEDPSMGTAQIENAAAARVTVHLTREGTTSLKITDGDQVYTYTVGTVESGSVIATDLWLPVDVEETLILPDHPALSGEATAQLDTPAYGEARLVSAEEGSVCVRFTRYGSCELVVQDGSRYAYYIVETVKKDGVIGIELRQDTEIQTDP